MILKWSRNCKTDRPNTLGFRLSGEITRDEGIQILNPVREELERGEKVRSSS